MTAPEPPRYGIERPTESWHYVVDYGWDGRVVAEGSPEFAAEEAQRRNGSAVVPVEVVSTSPMANVRYGLGATQYPRVPDDLLGLLAREQLLSLHGLAGAWRGLPDGRRREVDARLRRLLDRIEHMDTESARQIERAAGERRTA